MILRQAGSRKKKGKMEEVDLREQAGVELIRWSELRFINVA